MQRHLHLSCAELRSGWKAAPGIVPFAHLLSCKQTGAKSRLIVILLSLLLSLDATLPFFEDVHLRASRRRRLETGKQTDWETGWPRNRNCERHFLIRRVGNLLPSAKAPMTKFMLHCTGTTSDVCWCFHSNWWRHSGGYRIHRMSISLFRALNGMGSSMGWDG